MENAQLIGLSRQLALRREMDVVANNVANINTAGYKRHSVIFEDYLMPVAEYQTPLRRDETLHYVHDRATVRDFTSGDFQKTDNPFDVAVKGGGWLVVETPDGERYTRNGALTTDANGVLVSHSGDPVLGEGGQIVVPDEARSVAIARDGTVSADGDELGKLRVVTFESLGDLTADEGTLYRSDVPPVSAENAVVVQGVLERSNVRGILEISRMIEITRAYASLTSALERTDRLRQSAIERLGQVSA